MTEAFQTKQTYQKSYGIAAESLQKHCNIRQIEFIFCVFSSDLFLTPPENLMPDDKQVRGDSLKTEQIFGI